MEEREEALYWDMQSLAVEYNGVALTFLALKNGEHKELYEKTIEVIDMIKHDPEEVSLSAKLQGCELLQHTIDTMKVITRIIKAAINKAKNEHVKFDAELAKKVEATAWLIHGGGDVRLWCDGEIAIKNRMIEPPLPGLKGSRFVFPEKIAEHTYVSAPELNTLTKLREQMKLVIQ